MSGIMAYKSVLSLMIVVALGSVGAQKEACLRGARFAYDLEDCHPFFICVGQIGFSMACPVDLVFSLDEEVCVYNEDLKINRCLLNGNLPKTNDDNASIDDDAEDDEEENLVIDDSPKGFAQEPRCWSGARFVAHEEFCQRYFDCDNPHMGDQSYLTPYEYECPYPMLFSIETMQCEHFEQVSCGDREEIVDPCEYVANKCTGPNCQPCRQQHASCVGQPDGRVSWPGREGTGQWVECWKQRTISQGDCGTDDDGRMLVFSTEQRKCLMYSELVEEICHWTGNQLPHATECHKYYDCSLLDSYEASKDKASICPYPKLFSVQTGQCEDFDKVDCGARHEAKTPCEYMTVPCPDSSFASCVGLPDGPNVCRTKEGSLHYTICKDERTIEMPMCAMDSRGLYMNYAPGVRKCLPSDAEN